MALTYYEPGEFAHNVDIDYPVLAADATNLVAHYKFDGDFTDSSGNKYDAVPNGTGGIAKLVNTNTIFGNYNLRLLGDPSQKTYVDLPSFQFGDAVSISFWFNWNLATSVDTDLQKVVIQQIIEYILLLIVILNRAKIMKYIIQQYKMILGIILYG